MCTLALYFHRFERYPVVVAANRDEHFDRPSALPALWNTEPPIIAGKDLRAGGTWLGVNEHGLTVGILNRRVNGIAPSVSVTRSRGLLCLDLLKLQSANAAAAFIAQHESLYNPFTLIAADAKVAYVAYNHDAKIICRTLDAGLHVFSSAAEVDLRSAKADRAHELFAELTNQDVSDSASAQQLVAPLQQILADHSLSDDFADPGDAICVHRDVSGTVSSSVIFYCKTESRFETFHCIGAPCENSFDLSLQLAIR